MRKAICKLPVTGRRFFGSHAEHAAPVSYSASTPFLSTTDAKKDMVALYGFNDIDEHFHADTSDPFPHIRDKGLISFERLVF